MIQVIPELVEVQGRRKVKVTMDANKARQAIGLEPLDEKGGAAKPGAKPAGKPALAK